MTDTRVRIIRGDYRNIKLTTPNDMIRSKAYSEERRRETERLIKEAKEAESNENAANAEAANNEKQSE